MAPIVAAIRKGLGTVRRRWRSDSGAEFVEAALAFPILLLLVLGIMDFGLMFEEYEVLMNAAREGARIAVLPDYQTNLSQNVTQRVNDYLPASFISMPGGLPPATTVDAPVTVPLAGTSPPKCISTVTVRVTYTHTFLFLGGIGKYFGATFGTKDLHAASTMRLESIASGC